MVHHSSTCSISTAPHHHVSTTLHITDVDLPPLQVVDAPAQWSLPSPSPSELARVRVVRLEAAEVRIWASKIRQGTDVF